MNKQTPRASIADVEMVSAFFRRKSGCWGLGYKVAESCRLSSELARCICQPVFSVLKGDFSHAEKYPESKSTIGGKYEPTWLLCGRCPRGRQRSRITISKVRNYYSVVLVSLLYLNIFEIRTCELSRLPDFTDNKTSYAIACLDFGC